MKRALTKVQWKAIWARTKNRGKGLIPPKKGKSKTRRRLEKGARHIERAEAVGRSAKWLKGTLFAGGAGGGGYYYGKDKRKKRRKS